MSDRLTIVMNTLLKAPSQYVNVPFESVTEFNGKTVFFGEDGIYEEGGQDDDGTDITAWVNTPNIDFESHRQKRIEAFSIGYESYEDIDVTLYADEDEEYPRTFRLSPIKDGQVQQDVRKTLRKYRYGNARYHMVRVSNVDGCDFSIDYLALAPVFLNRHSRL